MLCPWGGWQQSVRTRISGTWATRLFRLITTGTDNTGNRASHGEPTSGQSTGVYLMFINCPTGAHHSRVTAVKLTSIICDYHATCLCYVWKVILMYRLTTFHELTVQGIIKAYLFKCCISLLCTVTMEPHFLNFADKELSVSKIVLDKLT